MKRRVARIVVVVGLVVLPFVLLRIDAVRARLGELVDHLRVAGPLGALAFVAVDAAAALITTPLWLFSGVAGYVYGFGVGFALALPGVALGAFAVFTAGRLGLTRLLAPGEGDRGWFLAVHRAVQRDALRIVLLLRISVLPQGMLSYLLATTQIRFREFALATTIGLVPATLLHVYVGSIVADLAALLRGDAAPPGVLRWVVLGGAAVVSASAMVVVTRVTRRALARLADEA